MSQPERDEYDWIETVVRLGKALGMNPVRLRWKLRAWQDRQKGRGQRALDKARAVRRGHKVCPACHGINAAEDRICAHCGAKLRGRAGELVARSLRMLNLGFGFETALVAAFLLTYALVVAAGAKSTLLDPATEDLIRAGANFHSVDPAVSWGPLPWRLRPTLDGPFWRLLTYAFLHGGPLHLCFNAFALLYIAPRAREVYGGSKAIACFAGACLLAGAFSLCWAVLQRQDLVSIGASGGISGLIGLMLVWGQLDRTRVGIAMRNGMARWVLYTFAFGFFANADNAAHLGGLVGGALLALALPTSVRRVEEPAWRAAGLVASLLSAAAVAYIAWAMLA